MKQPEVSFDAGDFGCSHMMRTRAQIRDLQESLCAAVKNILPAKFMFRVLLNTEVLQGLIGPQRIFDRVDDVFKTGAINDCTDVLQEMI